MALYGRVVCAVCEAGIALLSVSSCGALVALCWFPVSFVLAFSFDLDDEERAVYRCVWIRAGLLVRGHGFFVLRRWCLVCSLQSRVKVHTDVSLPP